MFNETESNEENDNTNIFNIYKHKIDRTNG